MEDKRFILSYYKLYSLHTEMKKSKKILIIFIIIGFNISDLRLAALIISQIRLLALYVFKQLTYFGIK